MERRETVVCTELEVRRRAADDENVNNKSVTDDHEELNPKDWTAKCLKN